MLEAISKEMQAARAFEAEMRRFSDVVVKSPEIQASLNDAVDNGVSRDEFRDLYVDIASKNGCTFTSSDMEIAMHEQKQGKDKVIPTLVQKLITIL